MIINVFKTGISDSSGPIEYLFSDTDNKGELRAVDPELIRGDVDMVSALIDCNRRKWRYTSAVINFRADESPPPDIQQEIMDAFDAFAFAGKSPDTWTSMWVRHRDKGTVELHFLLPRIDLETGQDINAFQRGWDAHWRPWQRDMCALYGFTDPHTVRQITGKPKRESEGRQQYRNALYQEIEDLYREGALLHRQALEDYLASFATIHRSSAKSISIAYDPAERPMRLEGPIFERDFFEPHAGRRAKTKSKEPGRDRRPDRRMCDGYQVLTPRASDRNPSPFCERPRPRF